MGHSVQTKELPEAKQLFLYLEFKSALIVMVMMALQKLARRGDALNK